MLGTNLILARSSRVLVSPRAMTGAVEIFANWAISPSESSFRFRSTLMSETTIPARGSSSRYSVGMHLKFHDLCFPT